MDKFTLLVIDDEVANLKVLSSLLVSDYHVLVAKSGPQGIQTARDAQPDLILLDVIMPDMDGFEVIRVLQSEPQISHIPVIFITGLNSSANEEKGLMLGAVDYIAKPFYPAVVKARVSTQIKLLQQRFELQTLSQELKEAAEAKGRFLANMSHEIRTPLTTIIGYADGVLDGSLKGQTVRESVKTIATSGKHLLNLINDILDFSKIEAGQLDVEIMRFNLAEMLHQVYQMGVELAKGKPITLDFKFDTAIPEYIELDPTRLQQILLNLLSNAIKFTEQGYVTLRVTAQQSLLRFDIEDSGIGIAQDKLDDLFGAFSQLDITTTRKYGGTGLGLSISRNLAQRLGGNIMVQSEKGVGSCFSATVTLKPVDDSQWLDNFDVSQYRYEIPVVADDALEHITGKVLLAEDHEENRKLFCLILESLGLDVDAVNNGERAVEACLNNDYQLVLMDIQMPVMDGITAFNMLQSSGCDIPVIALTANVMAQDVEKYLAMGFVDHCAKPLDKVELVSKVKKHVDLTNHEFCLDDQSFMLLREQFKRNLPRYEQEILTAAQQNELQTLSKLIHKLKGSAASFNFPELTIKAGKIEQALAEQRSVMPLITELSQLMISPE